MKITKSQLKEIIKEEVSRLNKKTVLESRVKEINRELRTLNEGFDSDKFTSGLEPQVAPYKYWRAPLNIILPSVLRDIELEDWDGIKWYTNKGFEWDSEQNRYKVLFISHQAGPILMYYDPLTCEFHFPEREVISNWYDTLTKESKEGLSQIKDEIQKKVPEFKKELETSEVPLSEELEMSDIDDMSIEDKAVFSAMNDEEVEDDLSDVIAKYANQGGDYEGGYKDDVSISPGYLSESNKKGKMKITKSQLKEIIREEAYRLKKQYILEDKKKAIVNELRILNEDEDNGQLEALLAKRDAEFYKWFDSVNIPRYQDYAGVQNLSSNTILGNEFNDYAQHIRNSVDKRDWGMKYGDAVMSYLKDRYMNKINSIGDARVREFLKNPKVTDFNSNEEHVKQSIEANKFIDSIPSISDSKYLGGDASFSKISSAVDDMIEECIDRGYTHLIPIILPWFASSWKRNVIDNIGRLVKDDAVVTQELFGIGKKKKEAAAKAAEEEKKAAEEKNKAEEEAKKKEAQAAKWAKITVDSIENGVVSYLEHISSAYDGDSIIEKIVDATEEACGIEDGSFGEFFKGRLTSTEKKVKPAKTKKENTFNDEDTVGKIFVDGKEFCSFKIWGSEWLEDEHSKDLVRDYGEEVEVSDYKFDAIKPLFKELIDKFKPKAGVVSENKMKITKSQLKEIIREEAYRLKKQYILEDKKKAITRELRMLNEDDAVVTQELFGIGKKKKEAEAKAAEEEKKAAEEKKQKDADHKAIADQVYTVEKSIEMDADLRNSGQEGGHPEKYYDSLHKKIKELEDSFKSKYGQEAEEYKSLKTQ